GGVLHMVLRLGGVGMSAAKAKPIKVVFRHHGLFPQGSQTICASSHDTVEKIKFRLWRAMITRYGSVGHAYDPYDVRIRSNVREIGDGWITGNNVSSHRILCTLTENSEQLELHV